MKRTKSELRKAIKKLERSIDALIGLQDMGFGNDAIARSLELLNEMNYLLNAELGE